MRHRVCRLICLLVAACIGGASLADGFCAALEEYETSEQGDLSLFDAAGLDTDPVCGASRALSGSVSNHCYWAFPYRASQSHLAFDAMVKRVALCADGNARADGDAGVNHPDSYDLRRFTVGGNIVDVSLKDKAALQQTIVFLRVSGAP
ncbi:hypothetical protein CEP88_08605 [Roseobacter denitrificans]|uniref:Lipoprotein n=1 Tax=Roseobacter denitrificans (strain ATCC 33942 / OCh 114) TaxID=375451 RepID=Q161M6_ROSDO|nr:hypothetical protein [Roseobacter denitrificans]ABG33317.1 hypothetical protein RD1_3855 [Roseobacter denitrificans OCh 114]AVL52652.1 hypothetical protein CEP88_08605 [Roseobacter denitrificans]SFG22798.1 hypothetical protein SAMN05443635_11047 [Roseobacter denitrificans OCh 114]